MGYPFSSNSGAGGCSTGRGVEPYGAGVEPSGAFGDASFSSGYGFPASIILVAISSIDLSTKYLLLVYVVHSLILGTSSFGTSTTGF